MEIFPSQIWINFFSLQIFIKIFFSKDINNFCSVFIGEIPFADFYPPFFIGKTQFLSPFSLGKTAFIPPSFKPSPMKNLTFFTILQWKNQLKYALKFRYFISLPSAKQLSASENETKLLFSLWKNNSNYPIGLFFIGKNRVFALKKNHFSWPSSVFPNGNRVWVLVFLQII